MISDTKTLVRELEASGTAGSTLMVYGTAGSTLMATTLALLIATNSAFSIDNEKIRKRSVCTEGTASKPFSEILSHAERLIIWDWRQALRDQLADVCQEASVHGWDGYDAEPIKESAVVTARNLIDLMPGTILRPDIVPSPNGEIAFEWDRGKDYLFSIRTHGGLLVYAGLFGSDRKQYGQEPIDQELPRPISTILATYFS